MEHIFNPDNPVFRFINKVLDTFALSLLWTLCSIPIITIGPATCALYYAMVKAIRRERSYASKEFFFAFKKNLKRGIPATVILIILGWVLLSADFPLMMTFWNTGEIRADLAFVLLMLKLMILMGMACWIFPLMSRFDQKLLHLGQSALFLLLRYLHITLLLLVLLIIAVCLVRIELLLLAIVPGVTVYLVSRLLEPIFYKMVDPDEISDQDDPWFLER